MSPIEPLELLTPHWPCPANVRAIISTRKGGYSEGVYCGANLGDHVGDDLARIVQNRQLLVQQTGVQNWPWLKQVHGVDFVRLGSGAPSCGQTADGVFTMMPEQACAVLTADCLPILLCNRRGSQVAAVHAGWRGLAAGIVGRAVGLFADAPQDVLAYLGPAIGPAHFEVGMDVYHAFEALFAQDALLTEEPLDDWQHYFRPNLMRAAHFFADLYGLAKLALQDAGVRDIYGGDFCTYADKERFYSYRRDGVTGRMVTAIWLAGSNKT